MWIFTSKGFVSIVQDFNNPGNLLVRARERNHLIALFPDYDVKETHSRDYRFRITAPQDIVAAKVQKMVADIDYNNFKNSIEEDAYHHAASEVWQTMYGYQRRMIAIPKKDKGKGNIE